MVYTQRNDSLWEPGRERESKREQAAGSGAHYFHGNLFHGETEEKKKTTVKRNIFFSAAIL